MKACWCGPDRNRPDRWKPGRGQIRIWAARLLGTHASLSLPKLGKIEGHFVNLNRFVRLARVPCRPLIISSASRRRPLRRTGRCPIFRVTSEGCAYTQHGPQARSQRGAGRPCLIVQPVFASFCPPHRLPQEIVTRTPSTRRTPVINGHNTESVRRNPVAE